MQDESSKVLLAKEAELKMFELKVSQKDSRISELTKELEIQYARGDSPYKATSFPDYEAKFFAL